MSRRSIPLALLAGALATGAQAAAQGGTIASQPPAPLTAAEQTVVGVVQRVTPAMVGVETRSGSGSGFLIRADGIILTNAHVVGNTRTVTVELATGSQVQGTVLGADPDLDVAVVRIPGTGLPVVPLGDSDRLLVGQEAIAIGNPFGLQRTVTTGIVSGIGRNIEQAGLDELIQTDAPINPGNSGGPLLNSAGQVIGINTMILGGPGLGFAVPINVARDIAEQVISTGRITRAFLGINYRNVQELARYYELPASQGILLTAVGQGSPAAAAGLREGDVITRFGGAPIQSEGDFRRAMRQRRPGETVAVQGVRLRGGQSFTVQVRLGERAVTR